jgi:hypothetical protein
VLWRWLSDLMRNKRFDWKWMACPTFGTYPRRRSRFTSLAGKVHQDVNAQARVAMVKKGCVSLLAASLSWLYGKIGFSKGLCRSGSSAHSPPFPTLASFITIWCSIHHCTNISYTSSRKRPKLTAGSCDHRASTQPDATFSIDILLANFKRSDEHSF